MVGFVENVFTLAGNYQESIKFHIVDRKM